MKLYRLIRRDLAAPSLRERAAGLKAGLARIAHRPGQPEVVEPTAAPVSTDAPTDLAEACDWACRYRTWIVDAAARGDLDDGGVDRTDDRHEAVIVRAIDEPSKSPGDLAAKARLLLQDLIAGGTGQSAFNDDRLNVVVLREVDAMMGAAADALGADAELLRLGSEFDRVHLDFCAAAHPWREMQARFRRVSEGAKKRGLDPQAAIFAAWDEPGAIEINGSFEGASNAIDPICEAIWATPHTTPAGLAVKARAAIPHIFGGGDFEAGAGPHEDDDLPDRPARQLIEACCSLAGVDWRGNPIFPAAQPFQYHDASIGIDPVLGLIEAHRTAYAAWDRASDVSSALLFDHPDFPAAQAATDATSAPESRAFADLLAAQPTTASGLAALATYLPDAVRAVSIDNHDSPYAEALRAVCRSVRATVATIPVRPSAADRLVADITTAWASYAVVDESDDEQVFDRGFAARKALLDTADALPATRDNLTAKALALAWITSVDLWEHGRQRADYTTDGRLALDIDAIMRVPADVPVASPGPGQTPAGSIAQRPTDDSVLAVIEAHRVAYAAWEPHLDAIGEAKGGSPEFGAAEAAGEGARLAEGDAFHALITTPPRSTAGLYALADYLPGAVRANGISGDDNDALMALRTVCMAVSATAATVSAERVADPIHAAVAAARAANAAIDAFGVRTRDRKPRGWFREEEALVNEQCRTADIAFETIPTTQAGKVLLADFMAEQMDRRRMANGDPPEPNSPIWATAYATLSAALRAPGAPEAVEPDLSGASIHGLARLYDHLQGLALIASMACNAPMAWDDRRENLTAVGRFLEDHHVRLDELAESVVAEIRTRKPVGLSERDDRLSTLIKREMEVNVGSIDGPTFAEVTAAWGR